MQPDAYPLASPDLRGLQQRVPPFVERHRVSAGEDLQRGERVQARGQPFVPVPARRQRAAGQRLQFLLQPRNLPLEAVQPLARVLRLQLRYVDGKVPVVSGLKRISKPGLRVYAGKTDIPRVLGGLGIVIVSTSQGIMTGQQARQAQLGGEVLAFVW